LFSLLFILLGIALIPYAGIENDEALFAGPLYSPTSEKDHVVILGHNVALMLMSYLGTLKTLAYSWLFNRWRPGVWSIRLPVLLAGAATIFLFYKLVDRACGRVAAIAACALLACDTCFLISTVYDWGPVAIQHLLMVSGVLLILKFAQCESKHLLGWGFFLFGLAMWDKALASWWLGGLGVAAALVFPRELWRRLRPANVALALGAFAIGALPLIVYNVKNPLATFAGNARFSTEKLDQKAHLLKYTLEGSALFGAIIEEEWDKHVRVPAGVLERVSVSIRESAGEHRRSLMFWGFITSALAAPLWWSRRRAVFFTLVFLVVTWVQMVFTKDAGGGVHHTILLWPFPHMVTAAALAGLGERFKSGRIAVAALVIVIGGSGLLVTNQSLCQLIRNGTTTIWTDAIFPLNAELRQHRTRHMFAMDWGIVDIIRAMNRGQLAVWYTADTLFPTFDENELKRVFELNGLFITHCEGREVYAGINGKLRAGAEKLGYRPMLLKTIADRNGRPIFDISEFERKPH
jgi:hypothetical protein